MTPSIQIRPVAVVADDDRDNREMLSEYMAFLGFHHVEARDGWEALAAATVTLPKMVLLDVRMPAMDGIEVTRRLSAQARTAHTLIYVVTGRRQC